MLRLSIRSNRTEWRTSFTTREKELSIREMNIISGAEKSTALHILWLRYCAQFVDPFESFAWRMGFTTGEKELSIREMNTITGA